MNESNLTYILISPARNESALIEKTIQSVIKQTVLPLRWVIVNDGSTDNTSEIVRSYLADNPWIKLVDLPVRKERHFAAKVNAFNAGWDTVKNLDYQVIGNLDADVSFEPDYFEFLLDKMSEDSRLGVAGTIFMEEGYSSGKDSMEGQNHVAGAAQMFRRECFDQIGGYLPNKAGGIDWIAVTTARMLGWKTRAFCEKSLFHYRKLGTAERNPLASSFSYGEKDYYLGNHPLWELFRVSYRLTKRPYLLNGMALGSGYLWAVVTRQKRPISRELIKFHRQEEMHKLRSILGSLITFKRYRRFEPRPNE